jgi:hypothetical protein
VLSENLFVADAVLDGTDGAAFAKNMRALFNRAACVRAFRGYDAEVARRNLPRIGSRVQMGSKIGGTTDAETAFIDRARVISPDVVRMDFNVFEAGEMRSENAADGAAADDANLYAHAVFRASTPE